MKKIIIGNTSLSLFSNGGAAVLGFVNLACIARFFSVTDAGKWFMLLTVYTMLELLRSGCIQTPFIRFYVVASSKMQRAKLVAAAWQLILIFTLFMVVAALPFMLFVKQGDNAFTLARQFTPIWLLAALPNQLLQWQLQANSSFKKLAVVRLAFPVLFTLLLALQRLLKADIETVALWYAVLQFLTGFIGACFGWLRFGRWFTSLKHERQMLTGYGKFSMVTMIAASLLRSSDQFIIALWLGPAAVATYAIPQKLIEAIEIPVRSFVSVAIPQATTLWNTGQQAQLKRFFYGQCGFLMAIIIPLLAIFFFMPSQIVALLGGAKYHQSALILQVFCLYAALIPIDRYCGLMLDAINRPAKNTVKVILMLITNVLLDVAAVKLGYGLYGIAAVSMLTFLAGIVIGWFQLRDVLGGFSASAFVKEGILIHIQKIRQRAVAL
ncbi:lipopolysaccharide biosynthesis protein [Mucilaginibacter pedocola]|uniref:Polysaccharide biosynthesis protein C-terminal domain-containing protein n=1 Tax=Mucilaginibacter pedocola TaxID=1792845 RepID=A0A1S9P7T0_9SPHI|nr:oligosaccharide flippase family protein [Mucilaginibacter pedocola]OOQ56708.1 hypothetical protein BC343_17075 [Mucilaginibacter pedocola]